MKISALIMKNFMPYKNEVSVRFPQDDHRNVMIIYGDNMRGKTSFLNAIRWGFYGKALGRHLREIPIHFLLNTDAASEGDFHFEVRIVFKAGGHEYILIRKATKREHVAFPSRPEDFTVSVSLQKDDSVVPGHSVEAEINRYIPEQVSRFFLFDGELLQEYETLLLEGSEQGERIKNAIEQVLGVPVLTRGRDEIETILRTAQKQQSKEIAKVKSLEVLAERQSELQDKLASIESSLQRLKSQQNEMRSQREMLDDEIEKVDEVYRNLTESKSLKARLGAIIGRLDQLGREKKELAKKAWVDLLLPKLRARQIDLYNAQQLIFDAEEQRNSYKRKIDDLTKIISREPCPTCGGMVGSESFSSIRDQISELEGKLSSHNVPDLDLQSISFELNGISDILAESVGDQIAVLQREDRRLSVELTQIDNSLRIIEDKIQGNDLEEIARKRRQRDLIVRAEGDLDGKIRDTEIDLRKKRSDLEMISRQISNEPAARQQRSTAKVQLCSELLHAFSESVERLRDSLRLKVEASATQAFKRLSTQAGYQGLSINSSYGLSIIDDNGRKVDLRSAGAEQIVALSLIDGLARTGRSAGPVVMDTPFGRLDLKHRENILSYLPDTTSQLILLVHDGEVRKDTDLTPVASRIGKEYVIREITSRQSNIEVL